MREKSAAAESISAEVLQKAILRLKNRNAMGKIVAVAGSVSLPKIPLAKYYKMVMILLGRGSLPRFH